MAAVMLMNHTPAYAEAGPEERGAIAAAERALPRSAMDAAAAYGLYMRNAAEISHRFDGGASVAKAVKAGATYEPKQLARGAVAYGAVLALKDERFTRNVEAIAERHGGREAFAAKLLSNPYYAMTIPGAERTGMVVAAALGADGDRVRQVGQRVKMAAYEVQRDDWSKAEVSGRVQRLADVKALSARPLKADEQDLELALSAAGEPGAFRLPVSLGKPQASTVVARSLALAALADLGLADAQAAEQLGADPECNTCLRMAKLNLFQCLAVSKPWYEDVFCLGQHVLIDTGECVQAASGASKTAIAALTAAAPHRRNDD